VAEAEIKKPSCDRQPLTGDQAFSNKDKNKNMRYLIFLLIILQSCSVLRKTKEISKTDSTSHTIETKTLSAQIDSNRLTKSGSESETEITIEFGRDSVSQEPYYIGSRPEDFFFVTSEGEVKTSRPVKKVTIKGRQNVFNYDSLANHSKIDASEFKEAEKTVSVKTVTKSKKSVSLPWWCWLIILIIPCYYLGRYIRANWPKIKAWVIFVCTGVSG
jgi:hypothetical protein